MEEKFLLQGFVEHRQVVFHRDIAGDGIARADGESAAGGAFVDDASDVFSQFRGIERCEFIYIDAAEEADFVTVKFFGFGNGQDVVLEGMFAVDFYIVYQFVDDGGDFAATVQVIDLAFFVNHFGVFFMPRQEIFADVFGRNQRLGVVAEILTLEDGDEAVELEQVFVVFVG